MKRSKLYRSRMGLVDRTVFYSLKDAMDVLKKMPTTKFDETVEMSFRLGIDPRQSDQIVRGAMVLPQGTGKKQTVVVIAEGEFAQRAKDAGADEVGYEELLQRIKGGWLDFDVLIATPSAMKEVRTLGRVLGPRGLMPNPKTGTVTEDTSRVPLRPRGRRQRPDRQAVLHGRGADREWRGCPRHDPPRPPLLREGHLSAVLDAEFHHESRHPPGRQNCSEGVRNHEKESA